MYSNKKLVLSTITVSIMIHSELQECTTVIKCILKYTFIMNRIYIKNERQFN